MRDYLLVFIMLINLPIGIINPFYGVIAYTWVSYMYPQFLTWSFGQTLPVAKLAALSAVLGVVINRAADTKPLRDRANVVMVLLWCMFTISTIFAVYPDLAWNEWKDVSKLVVMALVTSTLLSDRKRTRYFLLIIAFSIGFYGVKGGLFSFRTGGEQMVWGPGTSIIAGNNAIGLALNMYLPIVCYLAQDSRGLLKRVLQFIFFISIPAVMFTYSRASAVTLAVVLLALVMKGRGAAMLISVGLIGAI